MKKHARAATKGVWRLCRWLMLCAIFLVALIGTALLRLSYQPFELTPYLAALEKVLVIDGVHLKVNTLAVDYNGSLRLRGEGLVLEGPGGIPVATGGTLSFSLSNHNLVMGRLVPKHVVLDGLMARIKISPNHIQIGGYDMPLQGEDTGGFDRISWMNSREAAPYINGLKSLRITDLSIAVETNLPDLNGQWQLRNSNIHVNNHRTLGMHASLTSTLESGTESTTLYASFMHGPEAQQAAINVRFDESNMSIFKPLLPAPTRNILNAPMRVEFATSLGVLNTLIDPQFTFRFGEGYVDLPMVYQAPRPFKEARLTGRFEGADHDTFHISSFELTDATDFHLSLKGRISHLNEDNPHLDLSLKAEPSTLAQFFTYLPDHVIPVTMNWLYSHINAQDAHIDSTYGILSGAVKDLPYLVDEKGQAPGVMEVGFNYKNLTIQPLEGLPPVRDATGQGRLVANQLFITADSARLGNQNLKSTAVTITNLMREPDTHAHLKVETQFEGPAQDVLDMIYSQTGKGPVEAIEGQHLSSGTLELPLDDHITFAKAQFKVASNLMNIKLQVPGINLPLKADIAGLVVTQDRLSAKGNAELDGYPVSLVWQEDLHHFGDKTDLHLESQLTGQPLKRLMSYVHTEATGKADYVLQLNRLNSTTLGYTVKADFANTNLNVPLLGWAKTPGPAAAFAAQGTIDDKGQSLWLKSFSLEGPNAMVNGSARFNPQKPGKDTELLLNPFQIGRSQAYVELGHNKFIVNGKALDLSRLEDGDGHLTGPANLGVEVELGTLYLPKGTMTDVQGNLQRRSGRWLTGIFQAKTEHNGTLQVNMAPNPDDTVHLVAKANNGGIALRTLGFFKDLDQGTLEANFNLLEQRDLLDFDAAGKMTLRKTYLIDAPILARLLSLLSLPQLFNTQKGILFDRVEVPLFLDKSLLHIDDARMTGPSLGLKGKGSVNLDKDTIDLKGTLIPAEGLNRLVGNIPVIGKIITGSQGAVVAADFNVRGSLKEPDITVNPLSIVTPGVVKDIFGALFGEEDKPNVPQSNAH